MTLNCMGNLSILQTAQNDIHFSKTNYMTCNCI